MLNPYEISALAYFEAGFSPLPASGKLLAVKGASGRYPLADIEQINSWIKTHKSFNVALRLPPDVIALDIDVYKGDLTRLAKLEEKLGTLPPTWNSDSRGGQGGKILYRVPPSIEAKKWLSNIDGITIVQHTHRYVMVLPSYNRESESRYMWYYGLNGQLVPDYHIPSIDDIAELPIEWAEALKKQEDQMVFNSDSEVNNYGLEIFSDQPPCPYMTILIDMCRDKLIEAYDAGLHDTGLSIIGLLVTAAVNGHTGISDAIDVMADTFCSAPRPRDLAMEWNNLLSFVLANVYLNDTSKVDSCDLKLIMDNEIKDEISILIAAGISQFRAIRLLRGRRGRLM